MDGMQVQIPESGQQRGRGRRAGNADRDRLGESVRGRVIGDVR